ncbi:hypothetical protein [Halorubrum laminariae]|uniref:hypothetical protein n=1 Tax=Halorubrum laminariae TaxID=1433523 RepID=UPI002111C2DE|nr:hypothetical protein [Halorubrum laminariae]
MSQHLKALTRPTPRCYNIADFSTTTTQQTRLRALARAFASALWARCESAPEAADHPAPRVDPPGASGQRIPRSPRRNHVRRGRLC